jgi:hypothetical protein
MIDRQHGRLVFECDTCDATFEGEKDEDFTDAWGRAKGEGWTATKLGKDWMHGCPECGASK